MIIKSDGNGSLIIPHWFLVLAAILVTLFSSIATVVATQTTLRNDVDYLMYEWEQVGPVNRERFDRIDNRFDKLERVIPVINLNLEYILDRLDKIEQKLE